MCGWQPTATGAQTNNCSDKQYKYEAKMCGWLTLKPHFLLPHCYGVLRYSLSERGSPFTPLRRNQGNAGERTVPTPLNAEGLGHRIDSHIRGCVG